MKYFFKLQLVVIILVGTTLSAQFQNANWYFGDGAGVSFNGMTPVNLLGGQTLGENKASASVSDIQGNLLFYTNGKSVYNKNNNIMQNGNNSLLCSQGEQSVVIVPIPNSNKYYIFTEDADNSYDNQSANYYYSIVDMDANNGLGVLETVNQSLFSVPHMDTNTGEYFACAYFHNMVATIAADGESYWLIIKPYHKFYAFNITETIFNPYPPFVESTFGNYDYDCNVYDPNNTYGCSTVGNESLKVSSDGSKIALTANVYHCLGSAAAQIFDFDNSTGIISNLDYLGISQDALFYYAVDFSPDNKYLYCIGLDMVSFTEIVIDRYDLTTGSSIPSNIYIGNNNFEEETYSLQRAIDGKLYIGGSNRTYLSAILNPNNENDIIFQENYIDLSGNISGFYLPQLVPYYEQDCPYNVFVINTITDGVTTHIEATNNVFATNIIETGANVTYNGGNSVVLGEFFKVENGAFLEIHTTGCGSPPPRPPKGDLLRRSIDSTGNNIDNDIIQLYPNPSSGIFNYKLLRDDLILIKIIDSKSGIVVKNYDGLKSVGTLNLMDLGKGIFFLKIYSKDNTFTKSIVIE